MPFFCHSSTSTLYKEDLTGVIATQWIFSGVVRREDSSEQGTIVTDQISLDSKNRPGEATALVNWAMLISVYPGDLEEYSGSQFTWTMSIPAATMPGAFDKLHHS